MSDDPVKKALEFLKDAPDVPPDPGDDMPSDDPVVQAYRDGLLEGRRQGTNHALVLDAEERVVEFAEERFGAGTVVGLMEDGNVFVIVPRLDHDVVERCMEFRSDLRRYIGENGVVPVPILRTDPPSDVETKARAQGRILKGMAS